MKVSINSHKAFEDVFHHNTDSDVFQFGSTFRNSDRCIAMTYMGKKILRDTKINTNKDILRKIFVFVSIYTTILGVTSLAIGTDKHWGIWYDPT